ncbi:MAG TPA: hypothetical protein V6D17_14895, partial [Candidatus Obscuribacterales bacterium]
LLVVPALGIGEELGRSYDWIIQVQTEPLANFLDFPGSRLRPMVKAKVTYRKADATSAQPIAYEDLFYHYWNALGMRRYRSLALGTGDQVAIRVSHKNNRASNAETSAAANAILRVFVDAYLKGNSVANIIVPAESMPQIIDELSKARFYPGQPPAPDEPVYSSIVLRLESNPPGNVQLMYYYAETAEASED